MKNKLFFIVITVLGYSSIYAQNLIQIDDWVAGTSGRTDSFQNQGTDSQNSRINMVGPYGDNTVVWQALADGSSSFNGGFSANGVIMDTDKAYRISFWIQSQGDMNCTNYTGFTPYDTSGNLIQPFETENGNQVSWPYHSSLNMPNNKWFLVIGHIRPNANPDLGISGIYDPLEGTTTSLPSPTFETTDFIFPSNYAQISTRIRAFMWACGAGETMLIAMPRVEEINGQELSLAGLLYGQEDGGGTDPVNPGSTVWTTDGQNINYSLGNVGIGTNALVDFKLAIDGNVRAREIKVDTEIWPDYVFNKNYELLTLEEVRKFIEINGHLPNIPSASEIKSNGLELGEMNTLLMEKIEELTLYILEQDKRIKTLELNRN
ncbi:hypothetical protein DFQ03_0137 [Maribacter caenipelagi]|uniref:Uncharacterized protein n=1 Tax=Maribacter caenipelagi TaxID=1447781 RepID=A0A4R7DH01_9FLAO|nr:hypothetical protein [Maribacter caenipelagi]TDS20879.1 hypothetical protein DFQ03_0137 [Maribacter caenipelagi]